MSWHIVWTCAEYVRWNAEFGSQSEHQIPAFPQLERAYFLDLLDDGEDAPAGDVVGSVTVNHIESNLWRA